MAKKVLTLIKLQIPGGQANPAPPVGPALGQHGVNIVEFTKAFNAQTAHENGRTIPGEITVYEDRSITFLTKTPPAAVLIKEALNLQSGSADPPVVAVRRQFVLRVVKHATAVESESVGVQHFATGCLLPRGSFRRASPAGSPAMATLARASPISGAWCSRKERRDVSASSALAWPKRRAVRTVRSVSGVTS